MAADTNKQHPMWRVDFQEGGYISVYPTEVESESTGPDLWRLRAPTAAAALARAEAMRAGKSEPKSTCPWCGHPFDGFYHDCKEGKEVGPAPAEPQPAPREADALRAENERLRTFRSNPNRIVQHDHAPGATYSNCIGCVADERDVLRAERNKLAVQVANAENGDCLRGELGTIDCPVDNPCGVCELAQERDEARANVADLEVRLSCVEDDRAMTRQWREAFDLAYERGKRIAELEAQVAGGAGLIAAERQRQVSQEGWTPEHDDEHGDGYLAVAAAHLCTRSADRWGLYAKHLHDRKRQLVIAGALIAAELDRLARTAPKEKNNG